MSRSCSVKAVPLLSNGSFRSSSPQRSGSMNGPRVELCLRVGVVLDLPLLRATEARLSVILLARLEQAPTPAVGSKAELPALNGLHGVRCGVPYCVPTAPAAFRMGVQRATSLLTKLARASGERPAWSGITLPSSSRRFRVASSSSALTSVSLSLAMISLGVPLGANSAFQALTW